MVLQIKYINKINWGFWYTIYYTKLEMYLLIEKITIVNMLKRMNSMINNYIVLVIYYNK